jgi:hypothetical protein
MAAWCHVLLDWTRLVAREAAELRRAIRWVADDFAAAAVG